MVSYNHFYNSLNSNLRKKKFLKFKKILNKNDYLKLTKKNYELIINTDTKNLLFKKYFSKRIRKNYDSIAYTTIITHSKISNNTAEQFFTKYGPLDFLPISHTKTSIVFSVFDQDLTKNKLKIRKLIESYNKNYQIKDMKELESFPLNLSLSRNYFHKNVLSFGDALHKIHPLAGQGFNMTLRDLKLLLNIIESRINYGLEIDRSTLIEFKNKSKHFNYIFGLGVLQNLNITLYLLYKLF